MISPTIGRVVWYHEAGIPTTDQPQAAMVAYVHSDTMVNLVVFSKDGVPAGKTSVFLYQGDGEIPSGNFCEWMPYQIGQAKAAQTAS